MRILEHRRHSRRDPDSPHLNPAGIALARQLGPGLGSFDRVVTSPKPRAVETAQALGRSVDAELPELGTMPREVGLVHDRAGLRSFGDYARALEQHATLRDFAAAQAALYVRELERVPDGGRLLLISHGGLIELGAVAAYPAARAWGGPLGYLEGVRLMRDGPRWGRGEVLRVEG
jgi:broad specificity phosphatase PhoE